MISLRKLSGHIICLTIYAIFGFNIIICKNIATSNFISPIALFGLRSFIAGALFWITSFFCKSEKVENKDFIRIFFASILGFFLTQVSFLMAMPHITPMDCSIIVTISPIFTMLIAAVALKEPITLKKTVGVLTSLAGILYLILNSVASTGGTTVTTPLGIFLMIMNVLCFSMYLGIFKPLINKYSAITFMKWIFLFSMVLSVPLSGKEIVSIDYTSLPTDFVLSLSYLILFATYIAYFLLPLGQRRIRPTLVSMYTYVQPIIATSFSIYLGLDTLNWQKSCAAALVICGLVIVSQSKSSTEVVPSDLS